MANPLVKKGNGYGYSYGYGYGYGESVPLLASGRRNLTIALLILAAGFAWLGFRFVKWQENRYLTAAGISWDKGQPHIAWEQLQKVDKWAVDPESYHVMWGTILVEKDPAAAYLHLNALSSESVSDWTTPSFLPATKLLAASRARDWKALEAEIQSVRSGGTLPLDTPQLLLAQAQLNLHKDQGEEGIRFLTETLTMNPLNTEGILLRSELQILSPNPAERNQALVNLTRLAAQSDPNSLKAGMLLLTGRFHKPNTPEWNKLVKSLEENPYLSFHYLTQQPKILNAALSALGDSAPNLSYLLASLLCESEGASQQNLLRAVYFAQESGNVETAHSTLKRLEEAHPSYDRLPWLQSRQHVLEQDFAKALAIAAEPSSKREPGFPKLLASIAKGDSPMATDHHRLAAAKALTSTARLSISEWVFAASIQWELAEDDRPGLTRKALEHARSSPIQIANFFLSKRAPESALKALGRPLAEEHARNTAQLRFRALVALRRLEEAETLLLGLERVSEMTKSSGLLMLALIRQDRESATHSWDRAWTAANGENNAESFATLGDLAFKYGEYDWAETAYLQCRKLDPNLSIGTDSIHRYAKTELKRGNTARAKELLEKAMQRTDVPPELRDDWAYLSILSNDRILDAKDSLREASENAAANESWARAFALAQIRTGQSQLAHKTIEPFSGREEIENSTRVVLYAAALANAKEEEAEKILAQIKQESLLPEETALLEEFAPLIVEEIVLPQISDNVRLYQPPET